MSSAGGRFQARDLGTLGGEASFGEAINERNEVVGSAQTASGEFRAFLWRTGQGMQSLGTLGGGGHSFAYSINDRSEVVGESEVRPGSDLYMAFLWTPGGGIRGLGTLGGPASMAQGINNRRELVGISQISNGQDRAYLWSPGRDMRSLGTLGGPGSQAWAINDATQIVGSSLTSSGEEHAFLWTVGRGMEDLGTLGGSGFSLAIGISQTGEVVGFSETGPGSGVLEAFLWTRGRGMQGLGNLGGFFSIAWSVNTHRQVVGGADPPSQITFPALWTPNGRVRRLPTLGGDIGDGFVGEVHHINEFGRMIGYSRILSGANHATLWTPSAGPLLADNSKGDSPEGPAGPATALSRETQAAICTAMSRRAAQWSRLRESLLEDCQRAQD
jgi:probable HAF family extracellular repeat protein